MDIHFLKSRDCFFKSLMDRSRLFEIRNNDRDFHKGDLCVFEEVFPPDYLVPDIYNPLAPVRVCAAEIVFFSDCLPGLQPGFCLLGLAFLGPVPLSVSPGEDTPPLFVDGSFYDAGNIPVIDVLFAKLTPAQFEGYLLGSAIKHALRLNWSSKASGPGSGAVSDARHLWRFSAWLSRLLEFGHDSFEASLSSAPPPIGSSFPED